MLANQRKEHRLVAVCDGRCKPLADMPDEAFATGILGDGICIEPVGHVFYSPVDGRVDTVNESGHAYTLCTDEGLDVLVHIGVDTVGMKGEGFMPTVSAGQHIKAGDKLAEADLDLIRRRGYAVTTAVVVTTPEKMKNVEYKYGNATGGRDAVMAYRVEEKEAGVRHV